MATYVAEGFARYGAPLPRGSRFWTIKALYDEFDHVPTDHDQHEVALEGQRDLQTMQFVFENAHHFERDPEFRVLLKQASDDTSLPEPERAESRGRNSQFHLSVAATCAAAGMAPTFVEPDLRCVVAGKLFSVAVKRVKGAGQLRKRVKEARNQIKRQGLPGIIAIDISILVNRFNLRPNVVGIEDAFAGGYLREIEAYVSKTIERYWELMRASPVRGIILHDSYVAKARDGAAPYLEFTYGFHTVPHNKSRRGEFYAFKAQHERGLRKLQKPTFVENLMGSHPEIKGPKPR